VFCLAIYLAEATRILMHLAMVLFALPGIAIVLIFCAFLFLRVRWKHRKRHGKKRLGFYPTTFALGLAFQLIQIFVAPNMEYTIAEKLKEEAEEDEEGGSDDPAKHLERQLKRIRRGQPVDRLTTILQRKE
jgi:amino acid transporter